MMMMMIENLFPGGNCSTRVKDENFMSLLWRRRWKWGGESVNNDKFCAAGGAEMKIELWSSTMAWKLVIEKLLYEVFILGNLKIADIGGINSNLVVDDF